MKNILYDQGFGTNWKDYYVYEREAYSTSVADLHEHDFYEINVILSGNVNILLKTHAVEGKSNFIVLTKPNTPHFVSCKPDTLYSRKYLLLSSKFIENNNSEWQELSTIFGRNGNVIAVSREQANFCNLLINRINNETDNFRVKLLSLYLLSYIKEFTNLHKTNTYTIPSYIIKALTFIEENYSEKITAQSLADKLYISRTTLMTSFKKYTDSTFNDYLTHCRIKNAIKLLSEGISQEITAEKCGFNQSSNLIRCFKRAYNMTPKEYISSI